MRTDRWLIAALIFLVGGIWLLLAWCHGNVGFSFAYPISGTKFNMDITSTGAPALAAIPLVILGLTMMLIALVVAIIAQFRGLDTAAQPEQITRLRIPFEE